MLACWHVLAMVIGDVGRGVIPNYFLGGSFDSRLPKIVDCSDISCCVRGECSWLIQRFRNRVTTHETIVPDRWSAKLPGPLSARPLGVSKVTGRCPRPADTLFSVMIIC